MKDAKRTPSHRETDRRRHRGTTKPAQNTQSERYRTQAEGALERHILSGRSTIRMALHSGRVGVVCQSIGTRNHGPPGAAAHQGTSAPPSRARGLPSTPLLPNHRVRKVRRPNTSPCRLGQGCRPDHSITSSNALIGECARSARIEWWIRAWAKGRLRAWRS